MRDYIGSQSDLPGINGLYTKRPDGTTCKAELHWYEAHGIGRKEMKIKRFLDE